MSYNREDDFLPSSPTSSLVGFAGFDQQVMDQLYPVALLEPGYTARLITIPPPSPDPHSLRARNQDRRRRNLRPLPRNPSVQAEARAPAPFRVRLPAVALGPVQSAAPIGPGLVAAPSPGRAALMARLTNEAMTADPPSDIRRQLADLRAMPIRRQLSLRDDYDDFRRNEPSYWDAVAGYIVGDVAAEPCGQCQDGSRIFTQCVVVRPPGGGAQPMAGVCVGCYYGHRGTDCSFHSKLPISYFLKISSRFKCM